MRAAGPGEEGSGPAGEGPGGARLRRRRGRRGATAAEFALLAVPAILLTYAGLEAAWQVATLAALDHAALRASRFGATGADAPPGRSGAPNCRSAVIPWFASSVTGGFLKPDRLTVTTDSYAGFSAALDRTGGTRGPGLGKQVVTYTLTYRQPWLAGGLAPLVTGVGEMTHRATITIKNEPFEDDVC